MLDGSIGRRCISKRSVVGKGADKEKLLLSDTSAFVKNNKNFLAIESPRTIH
jgi:hypothetical protein